MESNSLNIYERHRVSKKEKLSRDKVAGWQEVVAPLQSAIPNLSEEGDHPSLSFLLYFSMFFFLGLGASYFSLEEHLSAHFSRQNAVNPFLPLSTFSSCFFSIPPSLSRIS